MLIGGDTGGGHPSAAAANIELAKLESFVIPTATTVSVDAGSTINASATGNGNGGKVVLWSDQQTTFAGTILARGGAGGGDGGFVETSSHQQLDFRGTVDLRAPLGSVGTLLLDPADFYIVTTLGGSPTGASEMTNVALQNQLALGDLTITTSTATNPTGQNGDIFVYSNINWSSNSTLTLSAYNNITINAAITGPAAGGLTLNAGNVINATAAVNVATFTLQNGNWRQVSGTLPAFSAIDFQLQGGTFLRALGGDGSNGSPYQITDVYGLQGIGSNSSLTQNFALVNNIDASGTANWNSGAGFAPIGNNIASFSGSFDGRGFSISNLVVNRPTSDNVGLFGAVGVGVVQNVALSGGVTVGTPM